MDRPDLIAMSPELSLLTGRWNNPQWLVSLIASGLGAISLGIVPALSATAEAACDYHNTVPLK